MLGIIIYTPNTGADWPDAWQQIEYARKGKLGLSLTNYDSDSLPAIASGSWAEVAGSIYKWTSEEAISGSPSANVINYIKLVPGGSGDTAYVTATWTDSAPTWSDAYQGYYDGTSRYVAGCYYDGTNYKLKWIYWNRDCGPINKYYSPPMVPGSLSSTNNYLQNYGSDLSINTGYEVYMNVDLPSGAIITAFKSYPSASLTGIDLMRCALADTTSAVMASSDDGSEDTSITNPILDMESYFYMIYIINSTGSIKHIYGLRIQYTIIRRLPEP